MFCNVTVIEATVDQPRQRTAEALLFYCVNIFSFFSFKEQTLALQPNPS